MRTLIGIGAAVAVLALATACSGDGAPTVSDPGPPTTYLIVETGPWDGSVGSGGGEGTIAFEVRETEASTHETLADGQVVVYDYAIEGLEVVLYLEGHPCPSGTVEGEVAVRAEGPFPLDAAAGFTADTGTLSVEGSAHPSGSGTVSVVLDEEGCLLGPVPWTAAPG